MNIDYYNWGGGCTTCSGGRTLISFLNDMAEKYKLTVVNHNTQILSERQKAQQYQSRFDDGQFYFPLIVIGDKAVCGFKPVEIEDAIKATVAPKPAAKTKASKKEAAK